jgi:hypothetical protein
MGSPLTMTEGCKAERDSTPLQRIDLFRGLRKLSKHFSRGYKIASVELIYCNSDGRVVHDYLDDSESLVAKLFDKSLSYSVCGIHYSKELPFVYLYLVENADNSTTNIDSHFIDEISKIEFREAMKTR